MPPIAHWDDADRQRFEVGDQLVSYWTDLASAAGSVAVGVNRIEVDPGKRSTPVHMEADEEEIFYVLGGSGLAWQWDGEEFVTYEIRAGDCLVHLAHHEAHSVVAGPEGIDLLAFGVRTYPRLTYFPRLEGARMGWAWAEKLPEHQWVREAALGEPDLPDPSPRPERIVNLEDVPEEEFAGDGSTVRAFARDLASTAGSVRTGLNYVRVEPGKLNAPPHCHSAEEEFFIVLAGEGVCLLGDEEHAVGRGHLVSRPAGTRIAHAFRAGGPGLELLSYGTREANDIAFYPRSGKVSFRGVGLVTRVDRLGYWDGES